MEIAINQNTQTDTATLPATQPEQRTLLRDKDFLTTQEFAKFLGLPHRSIQRLVSKRLIKVCRFGHRSHRIRMSDIQKFVQSRCS